MIYCLFLAGYHGSGKDTGYDFFKKTCDVNQTPCIRVSIADYIKIDAANKFGFDLQDAHDRAKKDEPNIMLHGKSPREVCRKYAEDKFRENKTYFSDLAINDLKETLRKNPVSVQQDMFVIITDFRFREDYYNFVRKLEDCIKRIIFRAIWIERKQNKVPDPVLEPEERALDDFAFDDQIDNSSSLEDYEKSIKNTMIKMTK